MRKSRYFHGEADILLVPEEAVILWQLDLSMSPSQREGDFFELDSGASEIDLDRNVTEPRSHKV